MKKGVCFLATFLVIFANLQGISAATLGYGETCVPSKDECDSALNLVCDSAEAKCVCVPRYWYNIATELCKPALGGSCNEWSIEECNNIPYALCDDTTMCKCTNGYKIKDNLYCEAPKLGDHCVEDEQCSANSACTNEKCTCLAGFVPNQANTECLKVVENIGETCTVDAQCAGIDPLVLCAAGTCECDSKYYVSDPLNEKCLPVARKIGDQCSTLQQCSANFGTDALCTSSSCVCKNGLTPSSDLANCLQKSALTSDCVQDQQCSDQVSGSECFALKCKCRMDHDEYIGTCSKRPELIGEACTFDEQCTKLSPDAKCDDSKTCSCNSGFFATTDKKKCLKGAETIGTDCVDNVQCSNSIPNSVCDILTNECSCIANFVPAESLKKCLEKVNGIYDACTDNGQCTAAVFGEVLCTTEGKCDCKPNCHYLDSTCWKTKRLGETCQDNKECQLALYSERAVCRGNVCECKEGFIEDKVQNKCNTGSLIVANGLLWAGLLLLIKNVR